MYQKFILSLAVIALTGFAMAGTHTDKTVDRIFTGYEHNGIFFTVSPEYTHNPNECSAGTLATFVVSPDLSDVNQVLSVLMAAKLSNSKIDVEIYGDRCYQNHRVIRKIVLK